MNSFSVSIAWLGADRDRHPRVRGLVAEHVAAAVATLHPRLQHALGERLGLARIEGAGASVTPAAVLVAAVLAVEDLAEIVTAASASSSSTS